MFPRHTKIKHESAIRLCNVLVQFDHHEIKEINHILGDPLEIIENQLSEHQVYEQVEHFRYQIYIFKELHDHDAFNRLAIVNMSTRDYEPALEE